MSSVDFLSLVNTASIDTQTYKKAPSSKGGQAMRVMGIAEAGTAAQKFTLIFVLVYNGRVVRKETCVCTLTTIEAHIDGATGGAFVLSCVCETNGKDYFDLVGVQSEAQSGEWLVGVTSEGDLAAATAIKLLLLETQVI